MIKNIHMHVRVHTCTKQICSHTTNVQAHTNQHQKNKTYKPTEQTHIYT